MDRTDRDDGDGRGSPDRSGAAASLSPTPLVNQPSAPAPVAPPVVIAPVPVPAAPAPTNPAPMAGEPAPVPAAAAPGNEAKPQAVSKPKPKPKPAPPREMALSDDPTPVLQPETFFATAKASERYANIADAGGWPYVPGALSPASKGAGVSALRRRLAVEGDLEGWHGEGSSWTPDLTAAVKHFQFRNGLRQTGVVSGGDPAGAQHSRQRPFQAIGLKRAAARRS